jgi:Mn-dependent DtxR family transcriptional regulator
MPEKFETVDRNDTEQRVLERILSMLEQSGPMPLDDMVKKLYLYTHPAAERILQMATGDGLIEVDRSSNIVRLRHLGREVGQNIRQSQGTKISG